MEALEYLAAGTAAERAAVKTALDRDLTRIVHA